MTQESSAEWEMAIVLPLGVVASQLQRIETQLRLLNMKALDLARQRENRALRALVEARLEGIHETLGSITGLVADIEADLQPRSTGVPRAVDKDEAAPPRTRARIEELQSPHDAGGSVYSARKASPDRDD